MYGAEKAMDFEHMSFEQRKRLRAERFGIAVPTATGEEDGDAFGNGEEDSSGELRRKSRATEVTGGVRAFVDEFKAEERAEHEVTPTTQHMAQSVAGFGSTRRSAASTLWLDRVQDAASEAPLPRRERRHRSGGLQNEESKR